MTAQDNGTVPDTDVLSWVIGTCREFGLPASDADDDFFDIGGTSLNAVSLVDRAEQAFGQDALSPNDLFEHSNIREIAESIERGRTVR
jgi:acyl carrier protein